MKELKIPLKIIEFLADGQFHSGETLGKMLGISRAAINHYIKLIRGLGLEVFAVPKRGYCLAQPLTLLSSSVIQSHLKTPIHVLPLIDSTNQYLLDRTNALVNGESCVAEYQHAARGRRGRSWVAPFGQNIYLSMFWQFNEGFSAVNGLSLAIGIAVAETLREWSKQPITVKWPNDLYLHQKKLAGILVELSGQYHDAINAVIGVGINLMMPKTLSDAQQIGQDWINLYDNLDKDQHSTLFDRNQLIILLITALQKNITLFEKQGLKPFLSRWQQIDGFINQPVKLLLPTSVIRGIARGINEQGAFLLEHNNQVSAFAIGDISLRYDH